MIGFYFSYYNADFTLLYFHLKYIPWLTLGEVGYHGGHSHIFMFPFHQVLLLECNMNNGKLYFIPISVLKVGLASSGHIILYSLFLKYKVSEYFSSTSEVELSDFFLEVILSLLPIVLQVEILPEILNYLHICVLMHTFLLNDFI